ncbi:MAG: rhodanese-like domain-containing protein [Acidobacteriota bacterium]
MSVVSKFQIITFYEFKNMDPLGDLSVVKDKLTDLMAALDLRGTIILSSEGFNSTLGGDPQALSEFVSRANESLSTSIKFRSSFHDELPFKRIKVKVKPEIVTLKQPVDIAKGIGTHVHAAEWNRLISDPDVVVLDTRNDYEFRSGTFPNAVNPGTENFNELPKFIEQNLDPKRHKKVALFCTGGIRCEKFAPYMMEQGFETVYQLDGGILKYLEDVDPEESLWEGECFVFDARVTVGRDLQKGSSADLSQADAS